MSSRTLRTLGGIGAILTCPCHIVLLMLLFGGTTAGAVFARHLPLLMVGMLMLFLLSLRLLLRGQSEDADCAACAPDRTSPRDTRDDVSLLGGSARG